MIFAKRVHAFSGHGEMTDKRKTFQMSSITLPINFFTSLCKKAKGVIPWIKVTFLVPLAVRWRFARHFPTYRIAVRTQYLGGVGGAERHLRAVVESMPDSEFHLFCENFIKRGFIPKTWNYLLNPKVDQTKTYDIYFYLKIASPSHPDGLTWKKSVISAGGKNVHEDEEHFDCIVLQGENGREFCTEQNKCRRVVPDFRVGLPTRTRRVNHLPHKFFLTVFNPYDRVKGHDIMFRLAPRSCLPIVWSFSTGTFPPEKYGEMPKVENLIKLRDLSQQELYYLYEKAAGYVSFSRSEGLGWSVADAFMFDLPIISRNTGFVTFIAGQKGVNLYKDEETLQALLQREILETPNYDKSILKKYSYERLFDSLLNE